MFILISIVVFIVILALLVFVHEFGHFIVAKKSGMRVEEFGFGFPPRIWGVKKGDTIYSINAIPLGGFVKIVGEDGSDAADPRSFVNRTFWQRFLTLIAGVVMNFILAWVLLSIGFAIGLPTVIAQGDVMPAHSHLSSPQLTILDVSPGTPADKSGLKVGDVIISVNGTKFDNADDMAAYVKLHAGGTLDLQLRRGSENVDEKVFARTGNPSDGAMGIAMGSVGRLKFAWYDAPWQGLRATWGIMQATAVGFWQLVTAGQGLSQVGGPVKIAALTGQVTQLGFVYVLQFAAFLSVNLGIINSIPFPALDGGRVLFLLIEKVRGKRNNQTIEGYANTIGFALLLTLILFISVRDVLSLIHH